MTPANISLQTSFYQNPLTTTGVLTKVSDYTDKCRVGAWIDTLKQYKMICNTSSTWDRASSSFHEILSKAENRTFTCSIRAWKNTFKQYNITKEDFMELLKSENDIPEEEGDSINRDMTKESMEKRLDEVARLHSSNNESWSKAAGIGLFFLGAVAFSMGGIGLVFCACYATKLCN